MAFSTGRNLDFQEAMRIDSSGRVGIGTSSPAVPLHIDMGTDNNALYIQSSDQFANIGLIDGSGSGKIIMDSGELSFTTGGDATTSFLGSSERMRIDSNGQVGIGTSSPAAPLEVDGGSDIAFFTGTNVRLKIQNPSTGVLQLNSAGAGDSLSFATVDTERMRIDSSGNLLVGKTTADSGATAGIETNDNGRLNATRNGSIAGVFNRLTSDGDIMQFRKDGTTVGSIGVRANDNLYINSPHNGIEFTNTDFRPVDGNGDRLDGTTDIGDADNRFKDLYLSGGLRGDTTFKNNAGTTEYARFDSSGNLLVGKTSQTGTGVGIELEADGTFYVGKTGDVATFNRTTSVDGTLIDFQKQGTTVGSIGVDNTDNITLSGNSTHSGLMVGTDHIVPYANGSTTDGTEDLGYSAIRWRNLYLSGGVYLGGTGSANHLDDYEEGTWTPTLFAGTTQATLEHQGGSNVQGVYTKIGRQVTLHAEVDVNNLNGGTGLISVQNLPFGVADLLYPTGIEASGSVSYYNVATALSSISCYANSGNKIEFEITTSGTQAASATMNGTHLGTGEFRFTITYFTS